MPTFLLNVDGVEAAEVATTMAARGYGVWAHDSWYSLGLREKLPYPQDAVRVGFIHYNTVPRSTASDGLPLAGTAALG